MSNIVCRVVVDSAELEIYFMLRHAVFVVEQEVFDNSDRDELDSDALHIVAIDTLSDAVVGTVRCYPTDDNVWFGGRLAVHPAYRQHPAQIGVLLCRSAQRVVNENGAARFLAYIQLQNVRFFSAQRWQPVGEPIDYCGKPHQLMESRLPSKQPQQITV